MHVSGKVFVWLAVLLAVGAVVLSVQYLGVRNGWIKVTQANSKKITDNEAKLLGLRDKKTALDGDYERIMRSWGQMYQPVEAQVAGNGALVLGLGRPALNDRDAAGNPLQPLVYAFMPNAAGGSAFVGEFKAARIDEGARPQSSFTLNRRMRPSEAARWQGGPNWRVRTIIPAAHVSRLSDLEASLALADELLAARQAEMGRQNVLYDLAQKQLKLRREEIEGSTELAAKAGSIPQEYIDGVLATLLTEEEVRNGALEEADRLRRELLATTRKFEATLELNEQLLRSLPGGTEEEPVSQR